MARLAPIVVPLTRTVDEAFVEGTFPHEIPGQRYAWTAAIPPLPSAAYAAIIFQSVYIHTQNWGRLAQGLERGGLNPIFFDGLFADEQFSRLQYSYDGTSVVGKEEEAKGLRGAGPGGFPPGYVRGAYFVIDRFNPPPEEEAFIPPARICDQFFRHPIGANYLPEEDVLEMPQFSFRDPAWSATYVPPLFFTGEGFHRERALIPREFMPKNVEVQYRAPATGDFSPWGVHTEWYVLDERLIILPFLPPGGSIHIGPGTQGRVRRHRRRSPTDRRAA